MVSAQAPMATAQAGPASKDWQTAQLRSSDESQRPIVERMLIREAVLNRLTAAQLRGGGPRPAPPGSAPRKIPCALKPAETALMRATMEVAWALP